MALFTSAFISLLSKSTIAPIPAPNEKLVVATLSAPVAVNPSISESAFNLKSPVEFIFELPSNIADTLFFKSSRPKAPPILNPTVPLVTISPAIAIE